jgi:hypothetical protein
MITLKQLKTRGLNFHYSDVLFSDVNEYESGIEISILQERKLNGKIIRFSSANKVRSIQLNNQSIKPEIFGDQYVLKLSTEKEKNTLRISF